MNETEMLERKRPRASVDAMLSMFCDGVDLNSREQQTRARLWSRSLKRGGPTLYWIPHRVWLAFHARYPGCPLDAVQEEVRAFGKQFKAEDDARAARAAVDAAWRKFHNIEDVMRRPSRRASVESTLTTICEGLSCNVFQWNTRDRLVDPTKGRCHEDLMRIPGRIWRAFYARHPQRLLLALRPGVRELAEQFRAEDAAKTAGAAFDSVLASHAIAATRAT